MHDPNLHLFVDDLEVKESVNVTRFINKPRRFAEPVLQSDKPWEEGCISVAWGSAEKDKNGLLRMWYFSLPAEALGLPPEFENGGYCYAESTDGIHWTKPNLGLVDWKGSKDNNYFISMGLPDCRELARRGQGLSIKNEQGQAIGVVNNMDGLTVLRDDHDPDPQRRYKLFANMQDHRMWAPWYKEIYPDVTDEQVAEARSVWGQYYLTSPDGLNWTKDPVKMKKNGSGDYMMMAWDERNRQWLLNERPDSKTGRTAGICRSKDLATWSEPTETIFSNGADSGFGRLWEWHGGVTPFNYGNQDIGFLEKWGNAGFGDTCELVSHRDGLPYTRVMPGHDFLGIGFEGSFDRKLIYPLHNPPIRMGDELYIYYTGYGRRMMEGGIGLAVIGLDRFAGFAHQRKEVGLVSTIPQKVGGSTLQVNCEPLEHNGEVRMAVRRHDNTDIPGFTWEECEPLTTDKVRAKVQWNGGRDLSELRGQTVTLHFQVKGTALYSYRWSDDG